MKIFMTGASGFIGLPTTKLLIKEGNEVRGLVRSKASAEKLSSAGATPVMGDLTSYDLIASEAAAADAVMHLGFNHELATPEDFQTASAVEMKILETLVEALKGTNKTIIMTSGCAVVGQTSRPVDESYPFAIPPITPRVKNEQYLLEAASKGIRTVSMRLPMYCYDNSGAAFSKFIEVKDVEKGMAMYVGDGAYVEPNTHKDDVAQSYVLALKYAKTGNAYNVASGSASGKEIATALAQKHKLPMKSITMEQALEIWAMMAGFFTISCQVDSSKAKRELHWEPMRHDFLDCVAGKVQ